MAISTEDKMEIMEIIVTTLKGGCVCGLSHETTSEVGHFFGRLKDLGHGNLNQGIEDAADAVSMMTVIRNFGAKVGSFVAVAIFMGLAGGVGALIVIGLKVWVKKAGQ